MEAFLKKSNFSLGSSSPSNLSVFSSSFGSPGLSAFSGVNNYGNNPIMGSIYQIMNWISQNPAVAGAILINIPVLAMTIYGFDKRRNINLGFSSLLLMLSVILLAYMFHKNIGDRQHYVLLTIITLIAFVAMVYFATQVRQKTFNWMYIKFYTSGMYKANAGEYLSYYGMSKDNDKLLQVMKGSIYSFALKEDMPMDLGTEFTYSFWLKICPTNFNKLNTKWRTIWYRGENSGKKGESIYKFKTPGVYLAPNTNKLIISVACENGPDEGNAITVDDIPLNEWFCVTISLEGRSLDCYINGLLEYSISLTGHPMLMNSNITKGRDGYSGLMAFFRYSSAALLPEQIKNMYEREKATLEESTYHLETCSTES